jgi:hypothetical protein
MTCTHIRTKQQSINGLFNPGIELIKFGHVESYANWTGKILSVRHFLIWEYHEIEDINTIIDPWEI